MTTAYLEELCEDRWSYTEKQVGIVDTCMQTDLDRVTDRMWAQTSWQISASRVVAPRTGMVKFNKRCAVTLTEEGDLESPHLVPARREEHFDGTFCRGQLDVVPGYAHINAQANRIECPIHLDFDKQLLDMLWNQDQVVSRVLCEIK
ncbi:hypothetical protein Rt10032_c11g4442 [Rhodotorula toruloides]|uniref:Uncharacterized protein n=1 Tax=Rhodotorula toruloides TaxID=5286 RepID=A0A511KKH8_RHOTO|nr:hypothetical protein Rt10032_c11g4442 [Rhodotorula toruloides]